MAAPEIAKALPGNQIDGLLPFGQEFGVSFEPRRCFT
jgi:hypothetical protein